MLQEPFGQARIDFAMNGAGQFAGDASRPDGAVAVNETQAGPHRSAAKPDRLSNRRGFCLAAIKSLRRRIDAEVKTLRIKRAGL